MPNIWNVCSVSCGGGVQTRNVLCSSGGESECTQSSKPDETRACNAAECRNISVEYCFHLSLCFSVAEFSQQKFDAWFTRFELI